MKRKEKIMVHSHLVRLGCWWFPARGYPLSDLMSGLGWRFGTILDEKGSHPVSDY